MERRSFFASAIVAACASKVKLAHALGRKQKYKLCEIHTSHGCVGTAELPVYDTMEDAIASLGAEQVFRALQSILRVNGQAAARRILFGNPDVDHVKIEPWMLSYRYKHGARETIIMDKIAQSNTTESDLNTLLRNHEDAEG